MKNGATNELHGPPCTCGHPQNWHEGQKGVCTHCGACRAFKKMGRGPRVERYVSPTSPELGAIVSTLVEVTRGLTKALAMLEAYVTTAKGAPPPLPKPARVPAAPPPDTSIEINGQGARQMLDVLDAMATAEDEPLRLGQEKVLKAIAERDGVSAKSLRTLTGYKLRTVNNLVTQLVGRRFVEREGGQIRATAAGRTELGPSFTPLPHGAELRAHWLEPGRLPEGESVLLELLIEAHPSPIAGAAIDQRTGYATRTRNNLITSLKGRGLAVRVPGGYVRASETLFEDRS